MNRLSIMGPQGHKELVWDVEKAEAGDPETLAVIAEAEQIVADAMARGHAVFSVEAPDGVAQRIQRFDRTAPQTVIVPRLAGG